MWSNPDIQGTTDKPAPHFIDSPSQLPPIYRLPWTPNQTGSSQRALRGSTSWGGGFTFSPSPNLPSKLAYPPPPEKMPLPCTGQVVRLLYRRFVCPGIWPPPLNSPSRPSGKSTSLLCSPSWLQITAPGGGTPLYLLSWSLRKDGFTFRSRRQGRQSRPHFSISPTWLMFYFFPQKIRHAAFLLTSAVLGVMLQFHNSTLKIKL